MHNRKWPRVGSNDSEDHFMQAPRATAPPHLVLLHQACSVVPHRPRVVQHNEAGLSAEPVMAQAGAACQGTLDACLELGCTARPVKAAFLHGAGQ